MNKLPAIIFIIKLYHSPDVLKRLTLVINNLSVCHLRNGELIYVSIQLPKYTQYYITIINHRRRRGAARRGANNCRLRNVPQINEKKFNREELDLLPVSRSLQMFAYRADKAEVIFHTGIDILKVFDEATCQRRTDRGLLFLLN